MMLCMLPFLAAAVAVFFRAITPSGVAVQVFIEMLTAGFEFVADEADPIKIDSHSELFVFLLHFTVAGALLSERLMIHRKREHDIRTNLSGMKLAVETAKLDRVITMKETVEI